MSETRIEVEAGRPWAERAQELFDEHGQWAGIVAFEEWLDSKLIAAGVDIGKEALAQPGDGGCGIILVELYTLFCDAYDGRSLEASSV